MINDSCFDSRLRSYYGKYDRSGTFHWARHTCSLVSWRVLSCKSPLALDISPYLNFWRLVFHLPVEGGQDSHNHGCDTCGLTCGGVRLPRHGRPSDGLGGFVFLLASKYSHSHWVFAHQSIPSNPHWRQSWMQFVLLASSGYNITWGGGFYH